MPIKHLLVRGASIPALSVSGRNVNPRDPEAVKPVKEAVIREMIAGLSAAGIFKGVNLEDIVNAVLRREQRGTTGIGRNIAIPHSQHGSVDEIVGNIAIAPEGLPFDSHDGEPVYVFVLLVSPLERPGDHLRALEAVVRAMKNEDFVKRLRSCTTKDEIWELIEATNS